MLSLLGLLRQLSHSMNLVYLKMGHVKTQWLLIIIHCPFKSLLNIQITGQMPIFWEQLVAIQDMAWPRHLIFEVLGGVAIFERGQHETGEDSVKTSVSICLQHLQPWVQRRM